MFSFMERFILNCVKIEIHSGFNSDTQSLRCNSWFFVSSCGAQVYNLKSCAQIVLIEMSTEARVEIFYPSN